MAAENMHIVQESLHKAALHAVPRQIDANAVYHQPTVLKSCSVFDVLISQGQDCQNTLQVAQPGSICTCFTGKAWLQMLTRSCRARLTAHSCQPNSIRRFISHT